MACNSSTPGDGNSLGSAKTLDGQLATPALTPISERADDYDALQPFPQYELDEKPDARNDREFHERRSDGEDLVNRLDVDANKPAPKPSPPPMQNLISPLPLLLPLHAIPSTEESIALASGSDAKAMLSARPTHNVRSSTSHQRRSLSPAAAASESLPSATTSKTTTTSTSTSRPVKASRSASSPVLSHKPSSSKPLRHKPSALKIDSSNAHVHSQSADMAGSSATHPAPIPGTQPSPMPAVIPLPPLSLPTYLQLELSSERPSPLYLHRSASSDFPYESSKVKFQRLLNFLLLPPNLESVLWFGAIACLDAFLYTFTILPLRFIKAVFILVKWWLQSAVKELRDLWRFVYGGVGRLWRRRRGSSVNASRRPSYVGGEFMTRPVLTDIAAEVTSKLNEQNNTLRAPKRLRRISAALRHRRTRSTPSALLPSHKADILQGLLIVLSCYVLMWFDASRMYHNIRGQSAIKLYVIYNVLEVFDRLFSALGQDILECLFSKETLERKENGRSKVIRPLWMFLLALAYNVIHSTALFYQVVTLNVAVNSYSNALLTLLMSNQFVEIKGTVFKKFEKENLFQLTCADVVERFQLWLMLLIIALRNIVEVGGLTISLSSAFTGMGSDAFAANSIGNPLTSAGPSIIPKAFTLFPKWTGEVLGPFLIVLGSEAVVDWCKHAYITKFNNVRPQIYGRFLDVLAKDYYSHAFSDQNLTKRLGLPVIPLSCLFIRACMQTYHMLLAIHMPSPTPSFASTVAIDTEAATTSPAINATLQHIDDLFRRAFRHSHAASAGFINPIITSWTIDDVITIATTVIFFIALYLVLLALKLVLGMALLSYARSRYKDMKEREKQPFNTEGGRRVGGWGVVEVNEDKRRWIYEDDPDGLRELRAKQEKAAEPRNDVSDKLDGVERYMMAAKRIW
ncbi:Hypothetical protein R9X50_00099800 [Acrodontium crateriforme]|uniref:DUF747-domain-containing protein n=1 Tax=Acrodontium crateriforme TaxID=150365 RepID=A0AAQ3LY80_9PEZI|nr:Hypothetical protein R9X50_00099800 [Acrodontium crateriforme]